MSKLYHVLLDRIRLYSFKNNNNMEIEKMDGQPMDKHKCIF